MWITGFRGWPRRRGKNWKEGTELLQAHQETIQARPGQVHCNKLSRFSSSPPRPLERFLSAAPTHTGCKDFTRGDPGPAIFTPHVHVFLILQWHHQATLGDLIQAMLTGGSGAEAAEKDDSGDCHHDLKGSKMAGTLKVSSSV